MFSISAMCVRTLFVSKRFTFLITYTISNKIEMINKMNKKMVRKR